MPKGNEYPSCECGRPLKRECERDENLCVNCQHAKAQAPKLHPIFAGLVAQFRPGA